MEVTWDGCGHSGAFSPVPGDVLTLIRTPPQVMWFMLHNFPNPRVKCEHMAVTKPSESSFSGHWTLNEVTWVPNNSNVWMHLLISAAVVTWKECQAISMVVVPTLTWFWVFLQPSYRFVFYLTKQLLFCWAWVDFWYFFFPIYFY